MRVGVAWCGGLVVWGCWSRTALLCCLLRASSQPPRRLLVPLPTVQGAGVVGKDQAELYGGRVGLIHNTLADRLLDMADVVVAVGYVSGSAAAFTTAVTVTAGRG